MLASPRYAHDAMPTQPERTTSPNRRRGWSVILCGSLTVRTILCGSLALGCGFALATSGSLLEALALAAVIGLVLGRLDRDDAQRQRS